MQNTNVLTFNLRGENYKLKKKKIILKLILDITCAEMILTVICFSMTLFKKIFSLF